MKNSVLSPQQALVLRLGAGLGFGCVLAVVLSVMPPVWDGKLAGIVTRSVVPALTLAGFVICGGATTLRRWSLTLWALTVFVLVALFAAARLTHRQELGVDIGFDPWFFDVGLLLAPWLFIAHQLVCAGDSARKIIAPYRIYVSQAWKDGLLLAWAVFVTFNLWIVISLCSAVLMRAGVETVYEVLYSRYFVWPLTGAAFAVAVHLGDIQIWRSPALSGRIRGWLAWLLPVAVAGGLAVVVYAGLGLAGTGGQPGKAVLLTLAVCAVLILLINASGVADDDAPTRHVIVQGSRRVACVLLPALAALAAYLLYRYIAAYGVTALRFQAAVATGVVLAFGLGYIAAAVSPRGDRITRFKAVNICLAFAQVVVFTAVLTPLADPLRVSAEFQTTRLEQGQVTPDRFDWRLLRFETGTYGPEVLRRLATSGSSEAIRGGAAEALAMTDRQRWGTPLEEKPKALKATREKIVVLSKDPVPESFFAQTYSDTPYPFPACLQDEKATCEARMYDLDGDGQNEILLYGEPYLHAFVFETGSWQLIDNGQALEGDAVQAFRDGSFTTEEQRWKKLRFGDDTVEYRDAPFKHPSAPSRSADDVTFVSHGGTF